MEWLSLIRCPTCSGTIRHDGEGMFRCSGCNANYPAAGSVPDFIAREGDIAAPGIELDYDYHLRRHTAPCAVYTTGSAGRWNFN